LGLYYSERRQTVEKCYEEILNMKEISNRKCVCFSHCCTWTFPQAQGGAIIYENY